MASGDDRAEVLDIDGSELSVGIISARWNSNIVTRLFEGAQRGLSDLGVSNLHTQTVPGAFELPLAAKVLAESGTVDAIVVLGAVIRAARRRTTSWSLASAVEESWTCNWARTCRSAWEFSPSKTSPKPKLGARIGVATTLVSKPLKPQSSSL